MVEKRSTLRMKAVDKRGGWREGLVYRERGQGEAGNAMVVWRRLALLQCNREADAK
jgi:hypothetical protein